MPVNFKWFKMGGQLVRVSVRSIIAIGVTTTLCIGALSGGMPWADFKDVALIVITHLFTVKATEEKYERLGNGGKEKSVETRDV